MNSVTLVGRLTKDPELRFTGTGKAVATFTLAINRTFSRSDELISSILLPGKKLLRTAQTIYPKGNRLP